MKNTLISCFCFQIRWLILGSIIRKYEVNKRGVLIDGPDISCNEQDIDKKKVIFKSSNKLH